MGTSKGIVHTLGIYLDCSVVVVAVAVVVDVETLEIVVAEVVA
jgi:hypothetical protein